MTEGGEGDTTDAVFTVTLDPASGKTVTVTYNTSDNTATAGQDYVDTFGTLTFAPDVTTQTITVTVNGDDTYEGNETFTVTLSNPISATLANETAIGTITDDDEAPAIQFMQQSYEVTESGSVNINVEITGARQRTVTATFATTDDTATAPGDYISVTQVITFTQDDDFEILQVSTVDDSIDEYNETVRLTLEDVENARLGSNHPATITIHDDDDPPTVSIAPKEPQFDEGDASATFDVMLSQESGKTVTVDYETSDGTATAGQDYVDTFGILTFAPDVTTQTITVPITDDTLDEDDETFTVTLDNASNATIADGTALGTITDDDPEPTLSIGDVAVTEGGEGDTTDAVFTVTLDPASGKTVTVNYGTENGTATEPDDYTAASGTVTFTPGITSQPITVTVHGDMQDEYNETFTVTLDNASNATIADGTALGTITDDDPEPTLSIGDVAVTEGGEGDTTDAVFTVTLDPASGKTVTVNYGTENGTATEPDDYTAASGTVTFTPGITSTAITVTVHGDMQDEDDETFTVTLDNASNATISDGTALGTIIDEDSTVYVPLVLKNYDPFVNGSFETGWSGWTRMASPLPATLVSSIPEDNPDTPPQDGDYALLLGNPGYACDGGVPLGYAAVEQTFSVPDNAVSLEFDYIMFTHDTFASTVGHTHGELDGFEVYINEELVFWDGNTVYETSCSTLRRVPGVDNPRGSATSGWASASLDLTAYRGQRITISFQNHNRLDNWYNTYTYIDNVRIPQ